MIINDHETASFHLDAWQKENTQIGQKWSLARLLQKQNGNEYPSIAIQTACLIERQVGDLPKPNLLFLAELRQKATKISTRIEGDSGWLERCKVAWCFKNKLFNKLME